MNTREHACSTRGSRVRGTDAIVERAHAEFGGFWRGTFLGIAVSLALWTMLLGLGSTLR